MKTQNVSSLTTQSQLYFTHRRLQWERVYWHHFNCATCDVRMFVQADRAITEIMPELCALCTYVTCTRNGDHHYWAPNMLNKYRN